MVMSSKKIGRMVDADVGKALANIGASTPKPDMKDDTIKTASAPQKAQTFAEAFKAARKDPSNKGTFTWFGKSYSTKMAGEGASKSKASGRSGTSSTTAAPKATAPTTNTRAATELRRTATRSQQNIRENRAENQADFRKRMQEKRSGTASTSTSSTGPRDNSFAARQTRKYGDSSPGNVLRAIKGIKDFNDAGLKRDVITDAKFKAQQKAKGYAKGGKIDGIAIRGKTRAPMKKGK